MAQPKNMSLITRDLLNLFTHWCKASGTDRRPPRGRAGGISRPPDQGRGRLWLRPLRPQFFDSLIPRPLNSKMC